MAAEEELSAVERTAKNNQVDTVEASDALNSRSPHFHPNFDLHQTDQKFYQFLEQQYGKEKADNPEFRAIIGNMLAQQAGGALSALKQMQTTPNPNSTESMIHAELRGGSPQLEAHLNQILAMKGITTRTDLSDPDLSLSLRQKYELLGMNPDGEDELRNYMGFLGLDKTENSLDQMRELKIQSTKIADKVIDAPEPAPDNKKNRL
ncbi:hypothetical protein CC99x_001325 [Candidatus Berkiella cookevillensis]|uniref:Uncharacterized protein n=1 Tax=Candidatus Berkiella cookevillensis TaxID=437022 RepID=A0A0Q9YG77_9GAMM|nr:hypothetical protein [Candidatus Berkiella cookevillensis]MCS5707538.1 hypothetical protein [Candidatus Berkiella cookevillensis]